MYGTAITTSREACAQMIAQALQAYTGEIVELPSVTAPPPKRSEWIDPEAIPKHKGRPRQTRIAYPSAKQERQSAMRRRGKALLRENWPELDLGVLAKKSGLDKSTIVYRLGIGQTLQQATSK